MICYFFEKKFFAEAIIFFAFDNSVSEKYNFPWDWTKFHIPLIIFAVTFFVIYIRAISSMIVNKMNWFVCSIF